jgi:hypothetical protein
MPGNVDDSGYEVLSPRAEQDLYEARGTPDSEPTNIPLPSMSPAPMGLQVPPGYVKYDPLDANHSNHVKTIRLDAYRPSVNPHYIKFDYNFGSNQHFILGLRDDADPPSTPYGWALEAAPFVGPALSPYTVDNKALGVLDLRSLLAREVDAALYALNDYGITADIDRYRGLMLDYETLLARQCTLDQELRGWCNRVSVVQLRLKQSQTRSRLHPYLERQTPIPAPPAYYDRHTREAFDASRTLSMAEALTLDPPGTYQSE